LQPRKDLFQSWSTDHSLLFASQALTKFLKKNAKVAFELPKKKGKDDDSKDEDAKEEEETKDEL
jgi:hypothetical protein